MGLGGSSSILFCAFHIAVASSQRYSPPADQAYTIETDLQSLLQDTTISQEKELSETLAWYQKLPSEGSCVQLAAMKLMSECKLLDNPSDFAKAHPDLYLDDVKTEYAVKLANCEIVGAQPDQPYAPQHCEVFIPTAEACIKRSWNIWGRNHQQQPEQHLPCYPRASESDLHRCLKTFRSSPQYWTSFSNAKFRAVNMCQLSRHAIEREKTLQLHKNLTHVTFRVQAALRGVQSEFEAFQERYKQNTDDIKHSTDQFRKFAQDAREQAQQEREQVKKEVRTVQVELKAVHSLMGELSTYNARFDSAIDASITRALAAIKEGQMDVLSSISTELETFYRGLKMEGSQLAAFLNEEIQQHHAKALLALQIEHGTMMQSYAIMGDALDDAKLKVDDVNLKVDVLDNKTDESIAKIDRLDYRLNGLGTRFKTVERAFAAFESLFNIGSICIVVIAMMLGICALCIAAKLFPARYVLALSAVCGLIYLIDTYKPLQNVRLPKEFLAIEPPSSFLSYLQRSKGICAVIAVVCLLLAAFLPKINSFCEDSRDAMAALPAAVYCKLLRKRTIGKSTVVSSPRLPSHRVHVLQEAKFDSPMRQTTRRLWNLALDEEEDQALQTRVNSFQRAQSVA